MIVAVDGRHLTAHRGVARYAQQMCSALAELPAVGEVRPFVPSSRLVHASAALFRRPTIRSRVGGDVVWLPAPAPGAPGHPYVLTVHDLSWLDRPADFTAYERIWHRLMRMDRLVRNAAAVVCDAEAVADEVRDRWGVSAHVVEPGVTYTATPATERSRPYFLYVGALEPRKGLAVLQQAWALAGPDADLLLVGAGRVRIDVGERLGQVDDAALQGYYAGAEALILPSFLEGHGFTPREAAAHGVPSIVSDLPTLQLPGTLRVPPGDVEALAAALTALPSERERLVAELPAPRSWSDAAAELAVVLAEAAR
jgi:glycosyltransferase involved in cell wall biosynthesis